MLLNTRAELPGPVAGEMVGEGGSHDVGHGHGAEARLALRGSEVRDSASSRDELADDADPPAEEVDPVDGQPEALALSQSHPCSEDDEGAVTVGDRGGERCTSVTVRGMTSASLRLGRAMRIHGDEAINRSPTAALKIADTQR